MLVSGRVCSIDIEKAQIPKVSSPSLHKQVEVFFDFGQTSNRRRVQALEMEMQKKYFGECTWSNNKVSELQIYNINIDI